MSFFPVWWIFNGAFPIGCRWASFGAMPSKGSTDACSGVKSRTMLRVFMFAPMIMSVMRRLIGPRISEDRWWAMIGGELR